MTADPMTPPAAVPVAVEATLAEVLGEHGGWSTHRGGRCRCGWTASDPSGIWLPNFRAHLAAVLAPVVAGAVERAVEEAAVRVEAVADLPGRAAGVDAGLRYAARLIREGGQSS